MERSAQNTDRIAPPGYELIAAAPCELIGQKLRLYIGGHWIQYAYSVDCVSAQHRETQVRRHLVADIRWETWQALNLPRAPVACSMYRLELIRPKGAGAHE
jgi:hypothetical protein